MDGGGPVLQVRKNDSIIRIDNSVEQKNQFGAADFHVQKQACICTEAMGCGLLKNYIPHTMTFHQISGSFLQTQSQKQPHSQDGSQFII